MFKDTRRDRYYFGTDRAVGLLSTETIREEMDDNSSNQNCDRRYFKPN